MLEVKAHLGGTGSKNLGESAVIAIAQHRDGVAILDDGAARSEATSRSLEHIGTLWIVVEAYRSILHGDRDSAARIVDDLLATDMRLPVNSGNELFTWAYENGHLP